jgi:Short-chain alcohol dehydrogenase of unknown specificity
MNDFHDNVVVITGASAGIGLEVARQLSAQGAKLVIAAREPVLLEAPPNPAARRVQKSFPFRPTSVMPGNAGG